MNEQNGDGRRIDVNRVIEHLQGQVARMAGELALRDAYIAQLEERITELETPAPANVE